MQNMRQLTPAKLVPKDDRGWHPLHCEEAQPLFGKLGILTHTGGSQGGTVP